MAEEPLVESKIEKGRRVVEHLERSGFEVESALWFYVSASHKWSLYLVTPTVDKTGSKTVYSRLQRLLVDVLPQSELSLSDISLLSPHSELIQRLRKAVRTGPGISGVRISRSTIDGVFIQDAYVYRLH